MGQTLKAGLSHKDTISWEDKEIAAGASHKISKIKLEISPIEGIIPTENSVL